MDTQSGFWESRVLGDASDRFLKLGAQFPDIAQSDRMAVLLYWQEVDSLGQVLGDKLPAFRRWWVSRATPLETLTRCLRGLRAEGLLPANPNGKRKSEEWRRFWARH